MKKFGLLAAAFAMVLTFASCSNGSDDDDDDTTTPSTTTSSSGTAATTVPAFEANATYKSAVNEFDGTQTITVKMTSATGGTINNGGDDKAFTIDSTTGALTYTGNNGDTAVSHILKVGEKMYALGSPSDTTSSNLIGTNWEFKGGSLMFTENKEVTYKDISGVPQTAPYTIVNGIVTANLGGSEKKLLFASSKLFFKYAELTKQ